MKNLFFLNYSDSQSFHLSAQRLDEIGVRLSQRKRFSPIDLCVSIQSQQLVYNNRIHSELKVVSQDENRL